MIGYGAVMGLLIATWHICRDYQAKWTSCPDCLRRIPKTATKGRHCESTIG